MNKKLLVLLTAGTLLVGCSNKEENKIEETKTEQTQDIKENDESKEKDNDKIDAQDYNFYLDKDGKIVDKDEIGDRLVLHWYVEPTCPHCIDLDELVKGRVGEILGDEAVVQYHYVSFMGGDYSNEASGYVVSIANNDPEVANKFIEGIMDREFIERTYSKNNIDDRKIEFKKLYDEIGGTNWDKVDEDRQAYTSIVLRETDDFTSNPELIKKSTEDYTYTPFIFIEGEEKVLSDFTLSEDIVKDMRDEILRVKEERK